MIDDEDDNVEAMELAPSESSSIMNEEVINFGARPGPPAPVVYPPKQYPTTTSNSSASQQSSARQPTIYLN